MAAIRYVRRTKHGLVHLQNASIQMPVSISPAVVVWSRRLFPIVNVLMAPQLGGGVCATRMVNAVGLVRNVRQHARRETSWNRKTAMFASATVPAQYCLCPEEANDTCRCAQGTWACATNNCEDAGECEPIFDGCNCDWRCGPQKTTNAECDVVCDEPGPRHVRVVAMFASPRTVVKKRPREAEDENKPAPAAAVNGSVEFHAPIQVSRQLGMPGGHRHLWCDGPAAQITLTM